MNKLRSKFAAGLTVFAMAMFATTASAAVLGTTLAVSSGSPALGSTVNVSGSCGAGAAAGGAVTFALVRNGVSTNVSSSTTTTGTNGDFSGSTVIPLTYGEGNATLVATCPNGDTINSSVLNVQALADPITLSMAPWAGTTLTISGLCTGTSAGGTTAVLLRNGVSTAVGTGTATAGANSTFNSSITIPTNYPGGPATLVVTCPGGETVSQLIITGGVSATDPLVIITPTDPTAVGGVGNEGNGIIPVGGVAAGLDLAAMTALASILLALGAALLLAVRHPHIRESRHRINRIGNGIRA